MARQPIPQKTVEQITAEWRTGEYSQQDLADRHKVSKGFVNKITKGVAQDMAPVVTAGVQYKQGLAAQSDRIVTAVQDAVNERARLLAFFQDAAARNVAEALQAPCEGQKDFKDRAETIAKGKEVVFGKTPDTAIQINNAPGTQGASLEEVKAVLEADKRGALGL